VLGLDVVDHPREVRRQSGCVFGGDRGLCDRLSALDNLRYFADLYALEPRRQRRRIDEVLELVGLQGQGKERVEGFSRGMRQRLHLAWGLLHDPPALFFDEPTIRIDPVAAREVRQLVVELAWATAAFLLFTCFEREGRRCGTFDRL
jgi:ABC-2 type transport system ATP-binding protein